ncbi:hypothetical protein OPV22_025106 [Ensete ventricosum]|uniref:Uncharacterized protein n=1 Tax=Ensete ventricosum TaxID=4639 RepID=A0AAV8QCW2_ENSVE|nr:hypothetical protein OPV22_025106 [Ensete ventricosum]
MRILLRRCSRQCEAPDEGFSRRVGPSRTGLFGNRTGDRDQSLPSESIQSPLSVSPFDLRPDHVAIVLREGRSSNGTIRGKEKIEVEIDGGGAAGAAAVSDWGGDYDGRRGAPARVHDVPHQARSFVILDLLQTDVGLKG